MAKNINNMNDEEILEALGLSANMSEIEMLIALGAASPWPRKTEEKTLPEQTS